MSRTTRLSIPVSFFMNPGIPGLYIQHSLIHSLQELGHIPKEPLSIGIAESRFSQFMNPVKELCDQTVIAGTFSAGDRHPCNKR